MESPDVLGRLDRTLRSAGQHASAHSPLAQHHACHDIDVVSLAVEVQWSRAQRKFRCARPSSLLDGSASHQKPKSSCWRSVGKNTASRPGAIVMGSTTFNWCLKLTPHRLIYHQASHVTATAREPDVNHVIRLDSPLSRTARDRIVASYDLILQDKTEASFNSISGRICSSYSTNPCRLPLYKSHFPLSLSA
jgi:hypothetical protein